ncbi:acyl-homoserine-lactone synthase [Pseudomonas sp. MSSRFD41]|uniref:acyl-homoserine-lactone synthase n=1 Tax=Pseudomonas sp. MSSRFD41 TaxID=1310370 RepID=UPI00163995A2|nr:acyl-homoserine-lactone synthase [Pseudomonas sp. MSSRFD41]MBC2656067.1 acyl-homoserine-lactone synthase [Pseudomonas sp. MSSRFD41]
MDKISFYNIDYTNASQDLLGNLYGLRKEVFADRLNWKVNVCGNQEVDEYDTPRATYLVGVHTGIPLASLRLINTLHPYMVEGPFRNFFSHPTPKHRLIAESSRFFVDKTRSRALGLQRLPLTEMLLLAMHSHGAHTGLESIITVVSQAMSRIVHRAGWHYEILDSGQATPGERVLLLKMPISADNARSLQAMIATKGGDHLYELHTSGPHRYSANERRASQNMPMLTAL